MSRVFSYVRFSSKRQEMGDSLRRQHKAAVEYCSQHGLILEDKTFEDLGVSAWKGDNVRNGALGAFLQAVDEGRIPSDSTLLVEHLDRVTRAEPMVAVEIFTGIVNRGLTLITLKDRQVYSREAIRSDWTKLLTSVVMLVQANADNENKSSRVRDGLARSRADGNLWKIAPAWLRLKPDRKSYEVIDEKAAIVKRVFAMSASGHGVTLIANTLNSEGIDPLAKTRKDTKRRCWTGPELARLLHNITVLGHCQSRNGEVRENLYPQIIDPTLFYTVQDAMKVRRSVGQGRKGEYIHNLLGGLCRCGRCGAPMRFTRGFHNNLHCTTALNGGGCDAPPFPHKPIEKELLSWLLLDFDDQLLEPHEESVPDKSLELQGAISTKTSQRDNLLALVRDGKVRSEAAFTMLNNVEDELRALQEQARSIQVVRTQIADGTERNQALFVEHQDAMNGDDPKVLFTVRVRLQEALRQVLKMISFTDLGEFEITFKNTKEQRFNVTYS